MEKYNDKYFDISKQVEDLIIKNKIYEAEKLMKSIIAQINNVENETESSKKCSFNDEIEFVSYMIYFENNKSKQIKWIPEIYSKLYVQYAYILIKEKEYDLAKEMLSKALKWNPMDVSAYYELADIYLEEDNLDKYFEYTNKGAKRIANFKQLAKYFRNLGYYYIKKEEYKLAIAMYCISLIYEKNVLANNKIEYIKFMQKEKFCIPDYKECFAIAKQNNIEVLPNIKLISKLYDFADKQFALETSNKHLLKIIYKLVYDFILDDDIKNKLEELDEKVSKSDERKNVEPQIIITKLNKLEKKDEINVVIDDVKDTENKDVNFVATKLVKKLNIENGLLFSSALEIIKLVINISLIENINKKIKIFDLKRILNLLMMNPKKVFIDNCKNLDADILKQIDKYYEMNENVQTEVIGAILYGFRKIKEDENIF